MYATTNKQTDCHSQKNIIIIIIIELINQTFQSYSVIFNLSRISLYLEFEYISTHLTKSVAHRQHIVFVKPKNLWSVITETPLPRIYFVVSDQQVNGIELLPPIVDVFVIYDGTYGRTVLTELAISIVVDLWMSEQYCFSR